MNKRPLKLLALLLTSMLIATASAAVYYSLILEPKVTTAAAPVIFVSGADSTAAGVSISSDGTWATMTTLKAYPNATQIYEKAINVSNTDTSAHDISLRHVSISPASGDASISNYTSITFKLVNVGGTVVATFQYTTTGDNWNTPSPTTYQSLPDSTQWTIRVETVAKAGASSGIVVNIDIALDVQ